MKKIDHATTETLDVSHYNNVYFTAWLWTSIPECGGTAK
jgi:hypothetical protein